MMLRWLFRFSGLLLVSLLLLSDPGGQIASGQYSTTVYLPLILEERPRTWKAKDCECVDYAVRYLFGDALSGVWNYAKEMASDEYFGRKEAGFRFRSPIPEPGDAIIFQPNSQFKIKYTKEPKEGEWIDVSLNNSAGHIGIIQSATFLYPGGWEIVMRSANWEDTYGWTHSVSMELACPNVGTSTIRVNMSELGISYWGPGPFFISNLNSGNVIDVPGWAQTDAELYQFDYTGGQNQLWWIGNDENNNFEYTINSDWSWKCMDVWGGSTQPGARILQYTCHYLDNQKWLLKPVYPVSYNIVSKNSNQCLDVEGSSLENGAYLIQNTCNGSDSQKWFLK